MNTLFSFVNNFILLLYSIVRLFTVLPHFRPARLKKTADEVFLLGNGPSLSTVLRDHSETLKKKALAAVNFFGLDDHFVLLKPQYYFLLDPAFMDPSNESEIKQVETLAKVFENVDWEMFLVMPSAWRKKKGRILSVISNTHIRVVYANTNKFEGFSAINHFMFDRNWGIPQSSNVLVFALYILAYLRVKKIFLSGADHNWHRQIEVNMKSQLCVRQKHFYNEEGEELNYAEYYYPFTVGEYFEVLGKTFKGYEIVGKYAAKRGTAIINISDETFVDAFPRALANDVIH